MTDTRTATSLPSQQRGNSRVGTGIDTSNYRKHTSGNPIQRRLIERFHGTLADRIAHLRPDTFLDAGCGEGFVTELLGARLPGTKLSGFDFNPAAVRLAAVKNPDVGFVTASIYDLPYPDGSFDAVGCFEVLEHQADPTPALRELARVSSRAVVLSVPHEPFFSLANAARGKNLQVRPRGSDPDHRQFWSRAAFGAFVDQILDVEWIGGSFPWTICVARKRSSS